MALPNLWKGMPSRGLLCRLHLRRAVEDTYRDSHVAGQYKEGDGCDISHELTHKEAVKAEAEAKKVAASGNKVIGLSFFSFSPQPFFQ